MLREELSLAHSIMTFENLNELLALLDQSVEIHSKMIKRYEDRLGVLLRQARGPADPRMQSAAGQFPSPIPSSSSLSSSSSSSSSSPFSASGFSDESIQQQLQGNSKKEDGGRKKKDDRRGKDSGEERGWVVLESEDLSLKIASGSDSQVFSNEISLLFKIIEALKSKLPALEAARKLLSELPSQGFKADRRLRIVFKEGIPRYVLPSTDSQNAPTRKFRYAEQFRIAVLK